MQINPVFQKLGLSDDGGIVILYTGDIGMCQASITTYTDPGAMGVIFSESVQREPDGRLDQEEPDTR